MEARPLVPEFSKESKTSVIESLEPTNRFVGVIQNCGKICEMLYVVVFVVPTKQ